ncbi:MAG: hypothetical protein WAX07_06740 [Candidatus Altiarchaeia archaeon]
MKNPVLFVFLLAALFALTAYSEADALIKDSPSMRVVSEEVSPEPVEPGRDVTVKVRVYNDYIYGVPGYGNASMDNAIVSLDVKYPFYLKTGRNMDEPQICMGCSKDYAYYLAVDAGAVSGVYPLTVKISRGAIEREYDINVKVVGVPDVVYNVPAMGSAGSSGGVFSVRASYRNIGTGTARNVKVSASSDKFIILGAGQKVIESLPPGNETLLELSFVVDESVATGSYSIPLQVSYVDERGKSYSSAGQIGVMVENPAKLGIESLKRSPDAGFVAGEPAEIQMRVENMGDGDAENVRATLSLPDGTSLVSYLGKLKPDDDAPAVFSYVPKAPGNHSYSLEIRYEDGLGPHVLEEVIPVRVLEKSGGNTGYIAVVAAVAVIALVLLFIRRK